jgi:5-methylcytosine-specific restriction endonuclease McrA
MKDYARSFYLSTAWKKTQAAYMQAQDYICERCGEPAKIVHHKKHITPSNINDTSITLAWDNLEALCQNCHNIEHHRQDRQSRYFFDNDGNILPPIPNKN